MGALGDKSWGDNCLDDSIYSFPICVRQAEVLLCDTLFFSVFRTPDRPQAGRSRNRSVQPRFYSLGILIPSHLRSRAGYKKEYFPRTELRSARPGQRAW